MKMETYTVQLNKENYFSVQSKLIEFGDETVRLVNLRSINGVIGEKFDLSDPKLQEIIMKYLRRSNNIELINIYSRKYNKFNWFEIYNTDEIINQSANELTENIQLADKFDESKVKDELKNNSGDLIPNKLYENINKSLPLFEKIDIDTCKFIPIWYINGSPRVNAKYCELFTTFEILIHILSKRFISFKSILLDLSSIHIQKSQFYGKKLEVYLKMEKDSLTDLLLQKDKTIDKLNQKIDDLIKTVKSQTQEIKDQTQQIKDQTQQIKDQTQQIKDQTSTIVSLKNDLNINTNALNQVVSNVSKLANSTVEYRNDLKSRDKKIVDYIQSNIPPNSISTGQTHEIFILFYSKSLNDTVHLLNTGDKLQDDDIILDSISCQLEDLNQHLYIHHKFDDKLDQFVFKTNSSNSLDINRYFKNKAYSIKPLTKFNTGLNYKRKFVVKRNIYEMMRIAFMEGLKKCNNQFYEFDSLMELSNLPINHVINSINDDSKQFKAEKFSGPLEQIYSIISNINLENEKNKKEIKDSISAINDQIKIELKDQRELIKEEIKLEIKEQTEKIIKQETEKISNQINSINDILTQFISINDLRDIGPNINQIYYNHRYRDLNFENDGRIKFKPLNNCTNVDEIYLTFGHLLNSIFRNSNKTNSTYKPDEKRKKLMNKKQPKK